MPLSTDPARTDLTDRECAKIIGSLIGGLAQMATIEDVRAAIRWWAECDEGWQMMQAQADAIRTAIKAANTPGGQA